MHVSASRVGARQPSLLSASSSYLAFKVSGRYFKMVKPTGAVAQLGERRVRNAEVEGSIPFRSIGFLESSLGASFSPAVAAHTDVSPVPFLHNERAKAPRIRVSGQGAIGGTTAFVEIGSRPSRSSGFTALPLGIPIARTTTPGSLPRRDHSTSAADSIC
jgi:hypothetical protein